MSLLCTPSTVYQSPSACVIARSLPYAYCIAYFLEKMVGMSEMQMLKKRGARKIPMGRRSGGVVTFAVAGVTVKLTNQLHDQVDHAPVR